VFAGFAAQIMPKKQRPPPDCKSVYTGSIPVLASNKKDLCMMVSLEASFVIFHPSWPAGV